MFRFLNNKKRNETRTHDNNEFSLNGSINMNITLLKNILSSKNTIIFREFEAKIGQPTKCCIVFADEMASREIINENVLKPLMLSNMMENVKKDQLLSYIINNLLIAHKAYKSTDMDEIIGSILYGDSVILVDDIDEAIIIDSTGWSYRAIAEPATERLVRGPREGFTESLKVNMSLIRRRIKNPDLKFEFMTLGTKTQTKIALCYLEGTANKKILAELKKRLKGIGIDGILDTGYIEELIKDHPLSPFKTIGNTERPDTASGKLLEGRIAILCDGTPFVLTLPFIFAEYFQSSEDYYNNYIYGSFNRLIRLSGIFISTSIPAMYIALVTFHQEMIPTPLFLSIYSARESVPLPTIFESLLMLFVFEIIREAGIRIPNPIGQAVSIVGALVLGEAAVNAKVISAPIVIVVALSGIGSILLPKMLSPLLLMRVFFSILASIIGIYGFIFGVIFVLIHLVSIESFGVPYMTNINSVNKYEIQDSTLRVPWWQMYYRPIFVSRTSVEPQKRR